MKTFTLTSLLFFSVITACAQLPSAVNKPDSYPLIHIAEIPEKLDFAGEIVPLQYAEVREALEREMSVTMYMHGGTIRAIRTMSRYFPVIEPILKQYGIPDDFKYLAMAESGLNPNAFSSARAAGMWQIVAAAAKDHGLETGDNVDLRYNVEQSTHVACKYLRKAYERYGSWTMAAASYNAGLAGVTRRANTQGVDNYYDLFLPEETMRYIYRILSFKVISRNPALYGFNIKADDYFPPFTNYKVVEINDPQIEWSEFAAKHGTNYKVLRILNPWIRTYSYTNSSRKSYKVMIPTGKFRELGF